MVLTEAPAHLGVMLARCDRRRFCCKGVSEITRLIEAFKEMPLSSKPGPQSLDLWGIGPYVRCLLLAARWHRVCRTRKKYLRPIEVYFFFVDLRLAGARRAGAESPNAPGKCPRAEASNAIACAPEGKFASNMAL